MSSIIIVQQIQYQTSKDFRRIAGLANLYRWPETARIPLAGIHLPEGALLQHILDSGPSERILLTDAEKLPLVIGGVTIERTAEEGVRVEFRYSQYTCGAPIRAWARQTFLVSPGEWAQVCYNGRFGGSYGGRYFYSDYWYYEKIAVNVGVSPEPHEDMFLGQEPTYRYRLISHL